MTRTRELHTEEPGIHGTHWGGRQPERIGRALPLTGRWWREGYGGVQWEPTELEALAPVWQHLRAGLRLPVDARVLVLCSAHGTVASALALSHPGWKLVGLEADDQLLGDARARAAGELSLRVTFEKAAHNRIEYPDEVFDAVVSDFILDPTPQPTEIGQPEMARVIKPGGTIMVTDVIVTEPLSESARSELAAVGLEYMCQARAADFRRWMTAAGLEDIEVQDVTPAAVAAWQVRRRGGPHASEAPGYLRLLDGPQPALGQAILYICARGRKRPFGE